ncbi:AAA domain-containing protein [Actinokineospora auranticolor]|uniref:AAA domain-containing protein n=1 Tax=Actinokineospora auranticolor TaxID=155976 RepID=A0A2S6GBY2_9PSEU|nr:AAA domain-containing protein [Actinokineospora auranticolor]PPK61869.1 AAA domain-containing protein [Actinokineospora auranticolor]
MPIRVVDLPTPLHLAPHDTTLLRLRQLAEDHPRLPAGLDQIATDLAALRDGVPATVHEPRYPGQDPDVRLYTGAYVLVLHPARSGRGFLVGSVQPIRLDDHHRLVRSCLLVRTPLWQFVPDERRLPVEAISHWDAIRAHWQRLGDERVSAAREPAQPQANAHTRFLDDLHHTIDAAQRVTTDDARRAAPYPYRCARPVDERGRVYEFELVGDRGPREDTYVRVRGATEQRGQVTRVCGRSVAVRFDEPVAVNGTGALEDSLDSAVFNRQRGAVKLLREGRAHNPHLLRVLVDHQVGPMSPPPDAPTAPLDDDQLDAFRRALAVPDVLLVLGPPGTGKTRVISQIARAVALGDGAARPPGRVLVTARTNRAVDNILGRLPDDLTVIRVGNEGVVTEAGRPYLLERRAEELRASILETTEHTLANYGDPSALDGWTRVVADATAALSQAIDAHGQAESALAETRRTAGGPLQAVVDTWRATCETGRRKLDRWQKKIDNLVAGGGFPLFRARRLARLQSAVDDLRREHDKAVAESRRAEHELEVTTKGLPVVLEAIARVEAGAHGIDRARARALEAAASARAAVGGVQVPPEVRGDVDDQALGRDLGLLLAWLRRRGPVLRAQADLLARWRAEVSGSTERLHPELVRYADVIAATTAGTASRVELSDVDFELAVVDEAGQIGVADALVPLVRARRAVLVGDHRQLPPYPDAEVARWGELVPDPAVLDLLTHSALERLVDRLPASNVVPLTWQRRMPPVVAEFISGAFYRGALRTAAEVPHEDTVFRSAFAFVDTSDLPRRFERRSGDAAGYINAVEAEVLCRLAAHYARLGREWAVIVPYVAQLKAVSARLVELIGDEHAVRRNVGSVDSFQGGERDVILYGFTRSNPQGGVGSLSELRHLNVALTRVRRQLVMVGDLSTLVAADDPGFRRLALALREHLAACGDHLTSDDLLNHRALDAGIA